MGAVNLIISWALLIMGGAVGTHGEPIFGTVICIFGILFSFSAVGRLARIELKPKVRKK